MSYICQYLQFGDNEKEVPGYDELTLSSEELIAPVYKTLVDPATNELWSLSFSYRIDSSGPSFIPSNQEVPGGENVVIKSWYIKQGGNGGPHFFTLVPFKEASNDAGFLENTAVCTFSEPGATGNTINTDIILHATVTAEIREKLGLTKLGFHSRNDGFFMDITSTDFNDVELLMPGAGTVVLNNTVTVKKGQSCLALVVFREHTTTKFKKIQYKPDWDFIPEIGIEILEKLTGKEKKQAGRELDFSLMTNKEPGVVEKLVDQVFRIHEPA